MGFEEVKVINDLEEKEIEVVQMEGKNMEKIGGKKEEDVEKRVVIGKGKGIGVEGMV